MEIWYFNFIQSGSILAAGVILAARHLIFGSFISKNEPDYEWKPVNNIEVVKEKCVW